MTGHARHDWDEAPVGLVTIDGAGLVRSANATFARWTGSSRSDLEGRARLTDLLSVAGRMYWETHLSPLLHVGEELAEVSLELLTPDGRMPVLLSARRRSSDGSEVLVALAGAGHRADFERQLRTARSAAESAAARVLGLQRATEALSTAVGTAAVRRAVVGAAVDALGAGAAELWRLDGGRLVLGECSGTAPRAGAPSATPSGAPPVPAGTAAVASDLALVLALRGQNVLHGVLRLVQSTAPGADPVDVDLATALGRQAALALDRALAYERTASIAAELQRSLLAAPAPRDPRFAVAAVYRPGVEALDVGGDWYDVFLDDADRLSFVVGDVVGRGLRAAAAMGQLRSAVRAVAGVGVAPAALLERLDRFVDQLPAAEMATVAYGVLDLATGLLEHSCAGHLPPVLVPAAGPARLLWGGRGTPLSGFLGGARHGSRVQLAAGDRLVLCTDGLVERRDRSLDDGLQALVEVADGLRGAGADEAAEELARVLLVDEVVRDDVCVLLLDWRGPSGPVPGSAGAGDRA